MDVEGLTMKAILYGLTKYYDNAQDTEKVIIECALVAAGADAVASVIPVLAIPAAITSSFGAVWVMYKRVCDKLGISIGENALKVIARAAIANIAANLGSLLIFAVVGMLLPGASIAASAIAVFLTVWLAGYVFLAMILRMAEKSSNPHTFSDISTSEMESAVKNTKIDKDTVAAAKQAYEENKDEIEKK